ncbi:MAG: phosphoglucomutase/phosphomannomutase family protein [Bacillota bacterium]
MKRIKFGTDGWRGIIADDFTFDNVRLVTRAITDYVRANYGEGRPVVVGYDTRFLSSRFAREAAGVLTAGGVPVYLTRTPAPTPVTAYAVKTYGAAGAVMFTASHNPPEYNGIKFIPHYAGPALPHITEEIEANIERLQSGGAAGPGENRPAGLLQEEALELAVLKRPAAGPASGKLVEFDPRPEYFRHLTSLIDQDAIHKAAPRVVVNPMFGAGIGYLEGFLRQIIPSVEGIQCTLDPLFGGSMPEPNAKCLGNLTACVINDQAQIGLALDGDADRFGLIDYDGAYITPNQFLPLLFHYLLTERGMRGPVARTVATTHLLDRMASRYGVEVYETPVGFKYIGQHLMEKGCILGGEESGGLSIKGHIPEKDGILAGLLAVEMVARKGKGLGDLLDDIYAEFGRLTSERLDLHTTTDKKQAVMNKLKNWKPSELAGKRVVQKVDVDGLKFVLEDGSWVLVRASGTEPVFRIYVESESSGDISKLQQAVRDSLSL